MAIMLAKMHALGIGNDKQPRASSQTVRTGETIYTSRRATGRFFERSTRGMKEAAAAGLALTLALHESGGVVGGRSPALPSGLCQAVCYARRHDDRRFLHTPSSRRRRHQNNAESARAREAFYRILAHDVTHWVNASWITGSN